SFNDPEGIAADKYGFIYVGDKGNNLVRRVAAAGYTIYPALPAGLNFDGTSGIITGIPTTPSPTATYTITAYNPYGSSSATGTLATFTSPDGTAVDAAGNIYVADGGNNMIRKITPAGVVTTLAGNGTAGSSNGPGASASFNQPTGVAADAAGNVYVADAGNN